MAGPSGYFDALSGVAIQRDGKIIAGGTVQTTPDRTISDFAISRFDADGSPDTTLGSGMVLTDFDGELEVLTELRVQPDGRILAIGLAESGHFIVLARYMP